MSVGASIAIHALILLFLVSLHLPATLRPEAPSLDVTLSEPAAPGGGGGGAAAPAATSVETAPALPAPRPHRPRPAPTVVETALTTEATATTDGTGVGVGPGDGTGTSGGAGSGDGTGTGDGASEGPRCGDPVNGVWVGRVYFRASGAWSEITLTMTRAGDRVNGTIVNHEWEGPPTRTRPIPCIDGGYEWRVRMPATGSIHDQALTFDSDHFEILPDSCWRQGHTYEPDRFVGTLDLDAEQLDMTWYDDGVLRDGQPLHFRRTGCVPSSAALARHRSDAQGVQSSSPLTSVAPR